jgi:hypothetical protein
MKGASMPATNDTGTGAESPVGLENHVWCIFIGVESAHRSVRYNSDHHRIAHFLRANCERCLRDCYPTKQGSLSFHCPLWIVRRSHSLHHGVLQSKQIPEDQSLGNCYASRCYPRDVGVPRMRVHNRFRYHAPGRWHDQILVPSALRLLRHHHERRGPRGSPSVCGTPSSNENRMV